MNDDKVEALTKAVQDLVIEVRALLSRVTVEDGPEDDDPEGDDLSEEEQEEIRQRLLQAHRRAEERAEEYVPQAGYDSRYLAAREYAARHRTNALILHVETRSKVLNYIMSTKDRQATRQQMADTMNGGQERVLSQVLQDLVDEGTLEREEIHRGVRGGCPHLYRVRTGR